MFNKIKRDFLILNMAIISILMLIICLYIYISMRYNMLSSISKDMLAIEQEYQTFYSISRLRDSEEPIDENLNEAEFLFIVDVSEKYSVNYFNSSKLKNTDLMLELTNICTRIEDDRGLLVYEEEYYYFSKLHFNNSTVRLIVLDVTEKMNVLSELFINLVLIGTVSLFLIFIISNFFTNKSVKPLEEVFIKQKNFISDASHELKTPLAVVKTNLEVLNKSNSIDEQDKKWLIYATEEIDQMAKMVNEFLYLAKMEDKAEIFTESIIDFSSIVNSVLLTMDVIAFDKKIIFKEDIEDDIFLKGNFDQLKRLVIILVDNAIKYCNDNGIIEIQLVSQNNSGYLIIKNTGTVIDIKDKDLIFEKFYRANKERERASHSYGIGLSIAKSTCQKHGFSIKAYPENDKTCFKVTFKVQNKV